MNRSESDCLFEDTSVDGAVGSSATITAPDAPDVFDSPYFTSSELNLSISDIAEALGFSSPVSQPSFARVMPRRQPEWRSCVGLDRWIIR